MLLSHSVFKVMHVPAMEVPGVVCPQHKPSAGVLNVLLEPGQMPIPKAPDHLQLDVCREQVEWATAEKRTFLRQRIEARLVALQLQSRNFTSRARPHRQAAHGGG